MINVSTFTVWWLIFQNFSHEAVKKLSNHPQCQLLFHEKSSNHALATKKSRNFWTISFKCKDLFNKEIYIFVNKNKHVLMKQM